MDPREYELMAATEDRMWWYQAARAVLVQALAGPGLPSGPMLDAGCGTGGMLKRLADALPDRALIGLDMAEPALAHTRTRTAAAVVGGSVNQLPFATASLAAIVSADVLCHGAVDQQAALAEMARCLKPGGRLVLNLPAYQWLLSAHDRRVNNTRRYVRDQVATLLRAAGLTIRRLTHWNAVLFPAMVLQRKLLSTGDEADSDVRDYPWLLDRSFGLLLAAERGYIRLGLDLAFGGSILAVAEKA